jgi:hypothetical protein
MNANSEAGSIKEWKLFKKLRLSITRSLFLGRGPFTGPNLKLLQGKAIFIEFLAPVESIGPDEWNGTVIVAADELTSVDHWRRAR